jgi:hypothetical protein
LSVGDSDARLSVSAVLPWTMPPAGRGRRRHRILGLLLIAAATILLTAGTGSAQAGPAQRDMGPSGAGSSAACGSPTSHTPDTTPRPGATGTGTGTADRIATATPEALTRPNVRPEQSPRAPARCGPGNGPDVRAADFTTTQAYRTRTASDRQAGSVDIPPADVPPADVSPSDPLVGCIDDPCCHPD